MSKGRSKTGPCPHGHNDWLYSWKKYRVASGEIRRCRVRKCRTCQNTKHYPRWVAAQGSLLWGGKRFGEE